MFILAEAVLPFRMLKSNRNVGNMHMLKITLYISTVFIMSILINSLLFQQVSAQSYNIKTIYLGAYDYGVTPLGLSKVTNTIYFGEGNPNIEGANSITGSTFKLSASGMLGDVLSISPNGGTLYAITGNSIIPINTLQNTIGNFIPVNSVGGMDDVIVSPNGSMIYASTKLGDFSYEYIYPYNLATSTAGNVITITTYGSALGPLAISPNGNTLYVGENPGKIYVVNLVTGTISNTINVPFNNKVSFTLSPNGNFLYAYGTPSLLGNIIPINTISYALGTPISTEIGTNTLSGIFSPDGKTFYAGEANGNIVPIDTSTYALDTPISTATNSILSLNMSPNGQILYAGGQSQVFVITFYPSISPSSSEAFDYGQSITFSSAWAGGTAPYTANWLIDNSITGVQLANALYTGISTTSNSFTWAFPSADVGNTVQGNVIITDSSTPQGISNSLKSAVITLNPSLGTPTLTSSPSLPSSQGNGNTITFTATATGGTSPYTYNYLITNTVTGNLVANMLFTNVASTTNSFAWTIPGADIGNTVQANVIVTDSAYSPETANSVKSGILTITYTLLSTPILSSCPSSPILDAGQTVSCTITVSGGVAPYTYNWLVSNSITDAVVANMLFTGVSSTGNTFEYTAVGVDAANSPLVFNVVVTDSHPTTINSIYSSAFTVNTALTIPSITPSNPTINSGQSVTFSSAWSGGTPAYGASLYSSQTSNCNQQSTLIQQDISLSVNTVVFSPVTPLENTYYCVFVTDNTPNSYSLSASIPSGFSNPSEAAFSPSGAYAYITNFYSNNVMIINTSTNTVTASITSGAFNNPTSAAFLASGAYAYVTNHGSNNVVIINTATNTVTDSITSGFDAPIRIAFSPSGTYAYVSNGNSANVVIVNTATNTVTGAITLGFAIPEGIAFSPSGAYAYVANFHSSNVVIVNTATNTVTGSILYGFSNPRRIAFSPSGTYAYVTNYGSDNIVIINTATNTVTGAITSGLNSPQGIAFSPSGTYAYVTNTGSNNVIIINTEAATTNSINSEITVNTGPQISNPYSGGSTGYFGSNSTLTSSTTSTISSSSTSTILPVTTITQIIASSGTTKACNDTSGYTINYPSLNATIKIAPGIRGCFNVNVTNSTSQSKTLNRSVITALNYTVNNTNVSTEAILHYPCIIPNSDVAPFILRNGTWQEITPFTLNVAACTVEFAVPSDPVIALLNTNVTSTITTTTATTTVQTSVPVTSVPTNTRMILEILIIIIIIIIAVALFLYFRQRR